jgi:integrase
LSSAVRRRAAIDKHGAEGEHDCVVTGCRPHVCKPMAASTVRQVHSIISGALTAAVRWDWISANPARIAQKPRAKAPELDPPTPAEAARLLDAAFAMDEDWGTLVWLVMTTGMRRGEVCALRWRDVDLDSLRRVGPLRRSLWGDGRARPLTYDSGAQVMAG